MFTLVHFEPTIGWSTVDRQLQVLKFKGSINITTWTVQAENTHVSGLFQLAIKIASLVVKLVTETMSYC